MYLGRCKDFTLGATRKRIENWAAYSALLITIRRISGRCILMELFITVKTRFRMNFN